MNTRQIIRTGILLLLVLILAGPTGHYVLKVVEGAGANFITVSDVLTCYIIPLTIYTILGIWLWLWLDEKYPKG